MTYNIEPGQKSLRNIIAMLLECHRVLVFHHPIRGHYWALSAEKLLQTNGQAEGVLDSRLVREFDAYLTGWG